MNVTVDLKRKDLVAITFYMLPRAKTSRIFVGVLFVIIFTASLYWIEPDTLHRFAIATFAALFGAITGMLAGTVIGLAVMSLTVGKKSGVLGIHHFSVSVQGLHEKTEVNESLTRWLGIQAITKTPNYLLFQINDYLFHVVPRRSFEISEDFDAFHELATKLRNAAL